MEIMEERRGKNVLVTGGTGLVGSHLVELLLQKGYSVTCLVRDAKQLRWLNGLNVKVLQGDCLDPGPLDAAVQGASYVFHVAGLTKARRARDYYLVNHLGTRNILQACDRFDRGIQKFILISSLAAAGPSPNGTAVTAADPANPVSDYGKSKKKAEEEALQYRNRFPVVILRPSAVYGPRDRDMYELFRWAARGLTIEISGGERFINPCYVKDLALATVQAAEQETESGSIFFVAEKQRYSWSSFRQTLLATGGVAALNIKIPYSAAYLIGVASELGGLFSGKPALTNRQKVLEASQRYWVCDTSETEKQLGFRSVYPLHQGLEITWKWYRDNNWL